MLRIVVLITLLCSCLIQGKGQNNSSTFRKRLDSIVNYNYKTQSAYYHFARLYQCVSDGVQELKVNGKLNDTTFINALEERFGHYYLSCYDSISSGNIKCYAWKATFDTTKQPYKYISSLIMSINAHVNHDLFFALTDVFKTIPPTRSRKKDYKRVAKVHDKIIADYIENIIPFINADKKWERQLLRKLSRQGGHGLRIERNRIWKQAKKATRSAKKFEKYKAKRIVASEKFANKLLSPKGVIKQAYVICERVDTLTFEEKVYLINNRRP